MADIGSTLREARMRARIDISEVEARTKIRAKYLRAIENEEWDLLPGPIYVKSFLRTYGDYLGLDSRLLIDEFKRRYERPSDQELRPISTLAARARARRPRAAAPAVGGDRGGARRGRRRPRDRSAAARATRGSPSATKPPVVRHTTSSSPSRARRHEAQARRADGRPACGSSRPARCTSASSTAPGAS